MLKILHVATGLNPGGAEWMLYRLLVHADRKAFDQRVIALLDEGAVGRKIKAIGVHVQALGMKRARPSLAGLRNLALVIREYNPDLIQGWMYHGSLAAQIALGLNRRRVPVLWNIRGSHTDFRAESLLTAMTIRLCSGMSGLPIRIVNNSRASMLAHHKIGFKADRDVVIPNGFDTTLYSPSASARIQLRRELGLEDNVILIGHVGRYHPVKDHVGLLRAAAAFLKVWPDVHFVLVGGNVDETNPVLAREVQILGIAGSIHMLGARDDLSFLTAGFDVATSSSRGEGFSNSVGEAMSCGVPCVVTDVGDSAWIVDDTGRVVPPNDPVALSNAWCELMDMGNEGRQALGAKARRRVIDLFTIDRVVSQYEGLYTSVCSDRC